jgi:hypothetical protein
LLGLIELTDGFDVSLLKILLLKLCQNHIFFFEFSKSNHKDFEVFFNIFCSLGLDLSSDGFDIGEVVLSDSLDKSLVFF